MPPSTLNVLRDSQKVLVTIGTTGKDKKGQPVTIAFDGVPVWASSNPEVAEVQAAPDGLSASVLAGVPGNATISVSGDADLGEGVQEIAGAVDFQVIPGAAVSIDLSVGTPEEQA